MPAGIVENAESRVVSIMDASIVSNAPTPVHNSAGNNIPTPDPAVLSQPCRVYQPLPLRRKVAGHGSRFAFGKGEPLMRLCGADRNPLYRCQPDSSPDQWLFDRVVENDWDSH